MADEIDVLQPVLPRDGNVAPIRDEVNRARNTELFLRNGEVQRKLFGVSRVMLEEDETVIKVGVERGEIIQKRLLAEPL